MLCQCAKLLSNQRKPLSKIDRLLRKKDIQNGTIMLKIRENGIKYQNSEKLN